MSIPRSFSILILLIPVLCFGQMPNANDQVPAIPSEFLLGVNPGYYEGWDDEGLADIGFGNDDLGIQGAGLQTLRGLLPEQFLEQWGYDVRIDEYEYFESLGGKEFTVTIGYPSDEHREAVDHCLNHQSEVFANLYLPIWDNGEGGTPVNDDNYYALYIYKLVSGYKEFIKIYEVWNEPDYDLSGNGYKDPGQEGNWWENIPEACDTRLRAPIFSYIRMLRIAYEVIKSEDSEALIAVGGIGYPSYLDLICRLTDNPEQGVINSSYPFTGGAWFDVLSYHSYPHFDGSMRDWDNDLNDFVYSRYSDAAVKGIYDKKGEFEEVLMTYNYDGQTYPNKHFIITESNLPRAPFDEYIGSNAAQVNFLMKTILKARQQGLRQFHIYKQGEDRSPENYYDSFDAMGLFENLEDAEPYEQKITDAGVACASLTKLTTGLDYDEQRTLALQLPAHLDGMVMSNGSLVLAALWAKTETDQSEFAEGSYTFPAEFGNISGSRAEWDFAATNSILEQPLNTAVNLNGRPSFFLSDELIATDIKQPIASSGYFQIRENIGSNPTLIWSIPEQGELSIFDSMGRLLDIKIIEMTGQLNLQSLQIDFPPGICFAQIQFGDQLLQKKLILIHQ